MGNRDILEGDCLEVLRTLPDGSSNCCVTSPPYWGLRDYGAEGQIGLEKTPEEHVERLVEVFREVRRVLRSDGTLWLNYGDAYAGSNQTGGSGKETIAGGKLNQQMSMHSFKRALGGCKPKDLIGLPWMIAFALRADGWWLRSDIVWSKPNPMPESVTDRPTKAHEYLFLLAKSDRYYYDADAIREPHTGPSFTGKAGVNRNGYEGREKDGLARTSFAMRDREYNPAGRNRRTVWEVSTEPYPEAHFATFPRKLVEPCILAGCPLGGTVLDPFAGSGTVGEVALSLGRYPVLIELNPKYCRLIEKRLLRVQLPLELV